VQTWPLEFSDYPTEELKAVGKAVSSASSLSGSIGDCRGFLAAALR
jgi:hypothetical protein